MKTAVPNVAMLNEEENSFIKAAPIP